MCIQSNISQYYFSTQNLNSLYDLDELSVELL